MTVACSRPDCVCVEEIMGSVGQVQEKQNSPQRRDAFWNRIPTDISEIGVYQRQLPEHLQPVRDGDALIGSFGVTGGST